jgi:hypothetical protein
VVAGSLFFFYPAKHRMTSPVAWLVCQHHHYEQNFCSSLPRFLMKFKEPFFFDKK